MTMIYVTTPNADGLLKIGCSRLPFLRIRSLNKYLKAGVSLAYLKSAGERPYQDERKVHSLLESYRCPWRKEQGFTEWFNCSVETAIEAVDQVIPNDVPYFFLDEASGCFGWSSGYKIRPLLKADGVIPKDDLIKYINGKLEAAAQSRGTQ